MRWLRLILAWLLLAALVAPAEAQSRRRPGKPLQQDFDMADIPEPKARARNEAYDFFDNSIFEQVQQTFDLPRHFRAKPAANVNAWEGVPDSSWFTNRNGKHAMELEEIRRGPNRSHGPETQGPWTIVSAKTEGATPGFQIRTASGERYLIKLDPSGYVKIPSSTEVVATKLYYAAGYNTPENYLVRFHPQILQISPRATIVDWRGVERAFTQADLEELLQRAQRRPDGTMQALASKFLSGKPVGPFAYAGLRRDDPNDWIPHEHRRDLRGLRVIAAWLNDNDVREGNTLDMYVNEGGRRFLRHYLLDFNSALGSEPTKTDAICGGFEYTLDWSSVAGSLFSLGLRQPNCTQRQPRSHPGIGALEAESFHPERWKQNSPIVAFENMTTADAYWAAKIVMSFTDEQIRAAIGMGEFDDSAAEYLARVLMKRRDLTGRHWFRKAGGLDNFRLEPQSNGTAVLLLDDLAVARGFAETAERTYRWRVVRGKRASEWQYASQTLPRIPLELAAQAVEVQVRNATEKHWSPAVGVHLKVQDGALQLAGWVREAN